ncbi:MAG: TRAP transporter small permease subunit [Pseudomonadales bacterium]|jgi:TRAP-type mannitol/chloroaromatic compound transport system permease small subunit|nr:TRAP transporter small permease subunit [Pseudomonadales bacterium]
MGASVPPGADPGRPTGSAIDETPPHGPDALPRTAFADRVDAALLKLGGALSWIWLLLLAVIVLNVVLRYVFGEGRVEFEEIQWHLYAIGFLGSLSLAVVTDDHVRVDVVHERLSPRHKAWIELYGTLLLLGPFLTLVLVNALPFVAAAWRSGEISQAPGGLPLRWAIKAVLPLAFALLALAALARLTRVTALLFGIPAPRPAATRADASPPEPR